MEDMLNNVCQGRTEEQSGTAKVISKFTGSSLSLISVVIVNSLLMLIALKSGLSITELIWLYWCEGVIIGLIQSFKVFSIESTSVSMLKYLRNAPPVNLTLCVLILQVPFHGFFALWIYHIDPTFDYVHGLLAMGGVILAHEIIRWIRFSRPWTEPNDLKNVIIESGIYLVRFIPVLALYRYMVKAQAGEGNVTRLTVEFMLFKFASDVISHLIGGYLLKNEKP